MNFHYITFKQLDSTNETAMKIVYQDKAVEGDVIVSEFQTAGKGNANNSWESEPGKNLTFSLILKPERIEPSKQFLLTVIVSLALKQLVESILQNRVVKIKWPNDIYVGNKKIAGILIQNIIFGNSIKYSIIGIGLNVNQKRFVSNAPNPVSLIHFTKKKYDLNILLSNILDKISYFYENISNRDNYFISMYENTLYKFNEQALYKAGNKIFSGSIVGVSDFGRLQIKTERGNIEEFDFKEVKFL